MSQNGQLIVFEGVDGAGKSSISSVFVDAMQQRGKKVAAFSFPGKEPNSLGTLVYRLHHNPEDQIPATGYCVG